MRDIERLRRAMNDQLKDLSRKSALSRVVQTLKSANGAAPILTEDTIDRFLSGATRCPNGPTQQAFVDYVRIVSPDAYREIEAPTNEGACMDFLEGIRRFYAIDTGKQQRLGDRLCQRYTLVRDAWMDGAARKDAVVLTQLEFEGHPTHISAIEHQVWHDDELLNKRREEKEVGIAVQFRTNFALFLKSGHSNGGMIIHIFDNWQEVDGKIARAGGISVPIISRQEQIPTAILMTQQPLSELGGPQVMSRSEFLRQHPRLGRRFIETEEKHYLQGNRQYQLV